MKYIILFICSIFLISCSKDEPVIIHNNCYITLVMDNVAIVNGQIYVTKDYSFEVENVDLKHNGTSEKITKVTYMIDNKDEMYTTWTPFKYRYNPANLNIGLHTLCLYIEIEDSRGAYLFDNIQYMFNVVPTINDLPNGSELGTYTNKVKLTPD